MRPERVHFYSPNDLACYTNMELAEKILNDFDPVKDYNINDVIELYQVKLYIDNEIYLLKWTQEDIVAVKAKCSKIWCKIVEFWQQINSNTISNLFNQLECWTLQKSFWEITSKTSSYKNISNDVFKELLWSKETHIRKILYQKELVKYYSNEIRIYLIEQIESAEWLLSQYVEKHDFGWDNLYFPGSLSLEDKETIILNYLESEDPNLNYVRLITNIHNVQEIRISDSTRLKAIRLEKQLNDKLFTEDTGVELGCNVCFKKDQDKPVIISKEKNITSYSYSKEYVNQIEHPLFYLGHFNGLFDFLDRQGCVSLVSKSNDIDPFEKSLMSAKSEYPISLSFSLKANLSFVQMFLYDKDVLQTKNQNTEKLIHFFITDYLVNGFGLKGLRFNLPSNGTSYLEKIRILLAEYDALLRQYKLYKENGEIDFDLLEISSKPYNLSDIPSFVPKKYCYPKNNYFNRVNNLMFSDQSHLCFIDSLNKDYRSLCYMLEKENLAYESFKEYQKRDVEFLIEENLLFIDNEGFVKIKDKTKLFILNQLYKEDVLNYWHYSKECRDMIDKMVFEGTLIFEETLFTRSEIDYFNYYLNKKNYSNGFDLRNSFMHGTNPISEKKQEHLYYVLLRILVLTVLKINDDQELRKDK